MADVAVKEKGRKKALTFIAGSPRLVAVVACNPQDPFLDGCESYGSTGEVFHGPPFHILLDRLIHHQIFELPELRADV